MKLEKKKVAVAISGGVDSAVAGHLLKEQGYDVFGLFMELGIGQKENKQAAQAICGKLGIKFYSIDISRQFKKEIIGYFIDSYKKGLTPNPCIMCNKLIKFGELLKYAKKLGADYLATGHYIISRKSLAVSRKPKEFFSLFKAKDKGKDQSYFLYTLTQKQLAKILFPLGRMAKGEVREIADRERLPYISKESQDVCFLNKQGNIMDHNMLLRKYIKPRKGLIKTPDGKIVGEHAGLHHFTIGQRRGIKIGGIGPFYAAKFDMKNNILYVVKNFDEKGLFSKGLSAKRLNWIFGQEPRFPLRCQAVIRYRHDPVSCRIEKNGRKYFVNFSKSQRAVTPGQSIVFYSRNQVLGGGVIAAPRKR